MTTPDVVDSCLSQVVLPGGHLLERSKGMGQEAPTVQRVSVGAKGLADPWQKTPEYSCTRTVITDSNVLKGFLGYGSELVGTATFPQVPLAQSVTVRS
jgi:hypothetical protein